jgi:RNA polymerase sigma-70 factor (ECF subfamily)
MGDCEKIDTGASCDPESPVSLVRRIQSGDSTAETELIHRYGRAVAALLERNLRVRADVDDLFQETFSLLIQKIRGGDVREPERLSGFVCSVARNLAISHVRRGGPGDSCNIPADSAPSSGASQLDRLLLKENAALVRRVLGELASERDREVLRRFYLVEESKAEICQGMELSGTQFDLVLFRARQRYRALYSRASGGKEMKDSV